MRTNTGQILYIPKVGQRANLQHPLMKGCVGWWPLNDGAGTKAVDLTANANHAAGQGGVNYSTGSKGVFFDSDKTTDSYFVSPLDVSGYTGATVSYWVNFTTDPDSFAHWDGLFKAGTSSDASIRCFVHKTDDEIRTVFKAANTDTGVSTTNSGSWNANQWYHFCATYDGTDIKIYLDGALQATTAHAVGGNLQTVTSSVFNIGTHNLPPESGNGSTTHYGGLQNFRVYNRALTAAEVSRLYQDPWAGTDRAIEPSPTVKDLDTSSTLTTNLVGWWPLTEFGPRDTLAYDISVNGNHGVANGGVQRQFTDTVRAASFDGVDDYIEIIGPPADTITQPLTLSAWVYNDASGSGTNDLVSLAKTTSLDPLGILRFTYTTGEFSAVFRQFSTASIISHAPSNPTGSWHHVCAVANSATSLELFVDGVSVASNSSTNYGILSYDNLTIGATQRTIVSSYSDANIQNVRVYSRALSAAEVQTLYDDPWVGLATDSLVYAYYSAAFLQRLG